MYAMLMQGAIPADDGLTWGEILSGIPHDGPAVFMYLLIAGVVVWMVWANRKRPKGPTPAV
jgi:hypothetical protein